MSLLLAIFAISVGYSIVLPVLPSLIEQSWGSRDAVLLARHTGTVTGTYILAVFLFAPLWGRLSDRWGRRRVLILGLAGFVASSSAFAPGDSIAALYLGRFFGGLFAAAIAPVSYALVGDQASPPETRAFRFALINGAGTLGFFAGPMLGAAALGAFDDAVGRDVSAASSMLSYASAVLGLVAAVAISLFLAGDRRRSKPVVLHAVPRADVWGLKWRLWVIAFATAAAIGAFEVGLSLRGKFVLAMDPFQIGMMFAVCSLVMFAAQAAVFSPWVKSDSTRWLFVPGIAALSLGLVVLPGVTSSLATFTAVTLIAASAGVLSPLVTYWASLIAGANAGADLGAAAAAASLGQLVGSVTGGFLFTLSIFPDAGFAAAALVVLSTLLLGNGLPQRLAAAVVVAASPKSGFSLMRRYPPKQRG